MIELLDHHAEDVALQIHKVFQRAYKVEAQLVGASEFPPLQRSVAHIRSARSKFLGQWAESGLSVVLEYSLSAAHLGIDSLVVHPRYFRRGLGSEILRSLLDSAAWQTADVETAAMNHPAIALYEKFGFAESKRWATRDAIEKVQLSLSKATWQHR
jgi:ribosomal protein S18 acetylase RimI-like enzyme